MNFDYEDHCFWVTPSKTPNVYDVACTGRHVRSWRSLWFRMTKPCPTTPVGTTASSVNWMLEFAHRHAKEAA